MNDTPPIQPESDPQAGNAGEHASDIDTVRASIDAGMLKRFLRSALGAIPTLIVLGILAALAWWGHHHGWSMPRFSELAGTKARIQVPWCDEHGVPEADCISCNADLMPKGHLYGWCAEHGVHECVLHNPQLVQLKQVPEVTPEDIERASRAIATRPRITNDPGCKMHLRRIQFPTIESVDRAGIDIGLVDRSPIIESIKVTGEVVFDPTRVTHLSSRAPGNIVAILNNVGDQVEQGDILAIVDAAEVGQAKSRLLQALVQLELDKKSLDRVTRLGGGVIPEKMILEAETAKRTTEVAVANEIQTLSNLGLPLDSLAIEQMPIDEVRKRLRSLGIPDALRDSLPGAANSTNLIPIVAPQDGIIVMRSAAAGEVVSAGQPLFTAADTSQMWLLLNVRFEEASRVSIGQNVLFNPDGAEQEIGGTISWISAEADAETRTIRVRAELSNELGLLRDETFGSGDIILREEPDSIVVPNDAIHWEGCCHVAFVRDKDYFKEGSYKVFHTRSVRPGAKMDDYTEVIAGLLPGEVVVTKGSGVLRAELLKGNLGAG